VPEDPVHSENTLIWLLKLKPDAHQALQLAALGHDIERAVEEQRVRKTDFADFDEFKKAHAANSAAILAEILRECRVDESLEEEICRIVRLHETGGDEMSDLLNDADAISYFDVNLPYYHARHGPEETVRRSVWGYRRLSASARKEVDKIRFEDDDLNALLVEVIAMCGPMVGDCEP